MSYLLSVFMAVPSSWASLSDRFWFILRGDPLACVTYTIAYKDRLARTGARKACAMSVQARNLFYFKVWVDEFVRTYLG